MLWLRHLFKIVGLACDPLVDSHHPRGLGRQPCEQTRQIGMPDAGTTAGGGVSVARYWNAGNVDYKKVVELRGVGPEQYRGKGHEEVREEVRVTSAG